MVDRAVKYKLGARAGKYKLGARAGKYKLGARAGKYKLAARTRGPENTNKNKTRIKQEPYCIIPVTYNV